MLPRRSSHFGRDLSTFASSAARANLAARLSTTHARCPNPASEAKHVTPPVSNLSYRIDRCKLKVWHLDLHAELSMIDENLCRNELSPAERAVQTARRKEIFEQLNPEVAHGGNSGPSGQFVHTAKSSFSEETAKATGKDERSVRRDAERGTKVIGEVIDMITGTKLDTGTYLDKLKRLTPNEQVTAAKRDLAQEKAKERDRLSGIARRTPSPSSPTMMSPSVNTRVWFRRVKHGQPIKIKVRVSEQAVA